jgi:hypothetical protein
MISKFPVFMRGSMVNTLTIIERSHHPYSNSGGGERSNTSPFAPSSTSSA